MKRINGSAVVITGASSGIGHATALAFARRGCSVAIAARGIEALEKVAAEVEAAGGKPLVVPTDVSRLDDMRRLAERAIAAFGQIDIWINNASVGEWGRIDDLPPSDMERVIAVDLLGTMWGVKAVLPHFRHRRTGTLINVASALAERAVPLLSTYCAAKAGVKAFTDALRLELEADGSNIDVVLVLPASINTPFYSQGKSQMSVRPHPLSVIYPVESVADAILRAAERPQRDVYVGGMGKLLSYAERVSPRAVDWYMTQSKRMIREQQTDVRDRGESNLYGSPNETSTEGDFTAETRSGKGVIVAATAAAVVGIGALLLARRR